MLRTFPGCTGRARIAFAVVPGRLPGALVRHGRGGRLVPGLVLARFEGCSSPALLCPAFRGPGWRVDGLAAALTIGAGPGIMAAAITWHADRRRFARPRAGVGVLAALLTGGGDGPFDLARVAARRACRGREVGEALGLAVVENAVGGPEQVPFAAVIESGHVLDEMVQVLPLAVAYLLRRVPGVRSGCGSTSWRTAAKSTQAVECGSRCTATYGLPPMVLRGATT
jgi:hypothetical protein